MRDLGGLATGDGGVTPFGAVVRADNPADLTEDGWRSLHAYGIRTVITLRTEGVTDDEPEPAMVPTDITIERVFVEDANDARFREVCVDTRRWLTPLHFGDMLDRWPERCAAAVRAVALAPPGGVVISCGAGRDRTGLVAFLLLALAGVRSHEIAADWQMSVDRLVEREPIHPALLAELMDAAGTTVEEAIAETCATLDVEQRLLVGGLTEAEVAAARRRLADDSNAMPA